MAGRIVFVVNDNANYSKLVDKIGIDFEWFPGFAKSQKQKSIHSLHENYLKTYGLAHNKTRVLEISTKSNTKLGAELSAFRLKFYHPKLKKEIPVENIFQSSKVFEAEGIPEGVQYLDLLEKSPSEAKKDPRLREGKKLIGFRFLGIDWPLEPQTLFYDWIYINAVYQNKSLREKITEYDAFTDIEFNPKKSINCQAKAAALYVSLYRRGLLEIALESVENYKRIITSRQQNVNDKQIKSEGQLRFPGFPETSKNRKKVR
ncbi:DarT1-associated NADAR antitoxin family protein [Fervidobacterium sp.]